MRKQFFAALEKIDSVADHAFNIGVGLDEGCRFSSCL
jgi:hypothetical protein